MRHINPVLSALLLLLATHQPAQCQGALTITGARATAMGNAYIAAADDPSAVIWNPAMLAVQHRTSVLQARQSSDSASADYSAIAVPLGDAGTLGVSYVSSESRQNYWKANAWTVGFGHRFGKVSLGASYNREREKIYYSSGYFTNFSAVTWGLLYEPDSNVRYGIRVRNAPGVIRGMWFSEASYGLPAGFDAGFSRKWDTQTFGKLTLAISVSDIGLNYSRKSVGLEVCPNERLAIRLGLVNESPSAGFGYKVGSGSLDVALAEYGLFVASGTLSF